MEIPYASYFTCYLFLLIKLKNYHVWVGAHAIACVVVRGQLYVAHFFHLSVGSGTKPKSPGLYSKHFYLLSHHLLKYNF